MLQEANADVHEVLSPVDPYGDTKHVWSGVATSAIEVFGLVEGSLTIAGSVEGGVRLTEVAGDLEITGEVKGDVVCESIEGLAAIFGTVEGAVLVTSWIGSGIKIFGSVKDGVTLADVKQGIFVFATGSVEGRLRIAGSVGGDVTIIGSVGGGIEITGKVEGETRLTPKSLLEVRSLRAASFRRKVVLGENVSLVDCDFRDFDNHEKLHFVGSSLFSDPTQKRRRVGHRDESGKAIDPGELAGIYRRLRVSLEKAGDRPGSQDFYYREMEARQAAAWSREGNRMEWLVLRGYRGLSAYGTRAWRPFVWFFLFSLVVSIVLTIGGVELVVDACKSVGDDDCVSGDGPLINGHTWLYTIQSMVSFFRPPSSGGLTDVEQGIQLVSRFTGPVLVTQFVLAIRERVAR